ncbi:Asp-tRNA(Asn)/Glu-tRNA(Gln) amidotransferase subunit GatA [Arcobacter lanthieri]|uniref:Asp-tRNA(Asn)/Glu-tRNA(Gln) amidotransferase subunit GatA n=1 Tax=Aliarcobacter lanthieri TaxID=1355374 RepID=UPI00192475B5|nr:Asp-tRNA(Asn)/Glu-tRNA(Gln) amidotransferase subunit GatA [Aliarcobacter lanthieri]MBL3519908.1 Asp-tRNA(Asn)/Glu-tRNA(Gln) amidotransferase subunit GatA [Aliarcobacter lanthieri]
MTLKEALSLQSDEIEKIRDDLASKIKNSNIGAYVEQLENKDINKSGSGIPIAIKNNINVKDWELTCSSNILRSYIAPYNATVIEKLQNAGLSPFGFTNMDEFAMGSSTESSCHGKTLNPVDSSRIPGGSSGGSAAAVAGGLAIAALGTDTGGSIRQPAAYCGCVGMKPTYGRVSRYGIVAYSSSLDQCGPITQNVEDAAILYDIIAGYDEKDSTSANIGYEKVTPKLDSNRKFIIAVIDNFVDQASDDIKDAFNKTVKLLEEQGHKIIHTNMIDTNKIISTYYIIASAEASANLARFDGVRFGTRKGDGGLKDMYVETKSQGFGYEVQKRIMVGSFVLSSGYYDAYYIKAQKVRSLIKAEFDKIFENADLILSPVAPTTAPKFGAYNSALDMYLTDLYTIAVNLAGLPAISLPVAKDKENLPIGLQLIANSFEEQTLFDGALSMEKAVNYTK